MKAELALQPDGSWRAVRLIPSKASLALLPVRGRGLGSPPAARPSLGRDGLVDLHSHPKHKVSIATEHFFYSKEMDLAITALSAAAMGYIFTQVTETGPKIVYGSLTGLLGIVSLGKFITILDI